MSEAAAEFLGRTIEDECVQLESADTERGEREPMTLICNPDTPRGDFHRLVARLEQYGYEIGREYDGDEQAAYLIQHPGYGGGDAE